MNAIRIALIVLAGLALPFAVTSQDKTPDKAAKETKAGKAFKESKAFFDTIEVHNLHLELGPKELDALRREARKYVKATLKEGDKIVHQDVGVHLKGAAGSFRGIDDKPNLTINMDKFVDDRVFHGLDKFHLANSLQDPSYISEYLCGELFRAAGVPASRVSFALVTINGKKRGLYYIKEGYDKQFLAQYFKNTRGNLYDGGFLREIDQPLQLLSTKNDVKPHTDLKALLAAANENDVKQRFDKLEKVLDMDRFLAYLCLESITWDWDGYPMNRNNYRIYHDPSVDKLIFIPSGMDQMFGNPGGPVVPGFQGHVARRLIETPEGQKRYFEKMNVLMKDVFRPDTIDARITELQKKLQPAFATVDQGAARDLPNHMNRLRQATKERHKSIEAQLKQMKK